MLISAKAGQTRSLEIICVTSEILGEGKQKLQFLSAVCTSVCNILLVIASKLMQGSAIQSAHLNKRYGEMSNVSHTETSQCNSDYYHKWIKMTEAGLMLLHREQQEFSELSYGVEICN